MKTPSILMWAIVAQLLLACPVQAVPVATVSTSASYDVITDSDSDTSFDPMLPAEAHALAKHPSEWYNATSDAQATIGGSVGAYCFAYGAYHETISATAAASNTPEWLVTSSTLPSGTLIYVLADVTFSGKLGSDPYSSPYASASASLSVDDSVLYEGSGTYSSGSTLDSSRAWIGDFTKSGWYYLLNTTDRIGFEAVVGQTLILTLLLETDVYVPDASESGATSDFLDSGRYVFVGAEYPLNPGTMLDVSFEMVPEPGTLLLLGLGVILLRRKR
jgi:hypothetical protein